MKRCYSYVSAFPPASASFDSVLVCSNFIHGSWSFFHYKGLPNCGFDFMLPGDEAVNFVILCNKLERGLGLLDSGKVKTRLALGVVDLIPEKTYTRKMADPDFHFGLVETFSLIKRGLFELCKSEISYEKLGIEFIYNPVFVSDLVQHINSVVLSQGKKLEYIHIYITLWTLDNDNDDDDDDNHDNQDDSGNVNQGLNNDIITKNKYDNGHDLSKKKFSFDKRLAKHHAYFFKSKVIRYPLLTGLQVRAYSSVKLSPIFMPGEMSVSFDYLCSALDLNVRLNYNKCYNGDLSIVSKIFDATDNYSSKYFIFFFDTERVGVHNLIMFIDENIKLFGMTPVTSNVRLRF